MCAQAAGGSGAAQEPEPAQPRRFDRASRGSKRRTRKLGAADGAATRRLGGRDAAHRQGMIVTLVGVACQRGCAFVAGGPLPLALPCRMGSILGSAPPPQQPLADTSAACRRQQMQRARQDAFSSANRRALATALPPLVDSVSSAHRSVMEALGLARRGGVSCPPGVHSDFASPQSAQPAEQLATTIRQLRGARIQGVTDLHCKQFIDGGVAQMVERSLSMREVRGSIPRTSK